MCVTKYLLVVTVALFASCSATSAATDSEQAMTSTMASPNMVKLINDALLENAGARFLRSSKTEEKEEERGAAMGKLAQSVVGAVKETPRVPKILQEAMDKSPGAAKKITSMLAKGETKDIITALLTKTYPKTKKTVIDLLNAIWLQTHRGGF